MTKIELAAAWSALWDLSEQVFDREEFVCSVISQMTSPHPECAPPSREDAAEAAVLLCQTIKAAIAVVEGISARLNDS
jgi:hypothetical protein